MAVAESKPSPPASGAAPGAGPADSQFRDIPYRVSEMPHHYGPNVHVLADPIALTHLARLCAPAARHPEIFRLVRALYEQLLRAVINAEFPRVQAALPTRMHALTPCGVYRGQVVDPGARVVTVGVARAGTYPSQVLFEYLADLVAPDNVRQDHLVMNRVTDAGGAVTGAAIHGSKVGGPVDGRLVLFPDPMGATGSSLSMAVDHYKREVEGGASARFVAMNLVMTPEYVRRLLADHPDVRLYAVRLDRGLSAPDVLAAVPGERWDEERGLTDHQYIVPGAGGFGEVMNNSPV